MIKHQFKILEGLNLADTQSSLRLIIGVSRDPWHIALKQTEVEVLFLRKIFLLFLLKQVLGRIVSPLREDL